MITSKIVDWIDSRVGGRAVVRAAMRKVFPDHWSFLLGEVALYSFVLLVATGVYLTFFFVPDAERVVYQGSYSALHGLEMSRAYESTLRLSFDIDGGLLIRQMHHWAALVFVAAVLSHLLRVFFTGAFRRPREINWMVGLTMLLLAIVNGFAGYSLPDDLLSGTGLRIAYSITESIPLVGTRLAGLAFGGAFPSPEIIPRLYTLHILLVPVAIGGLLAAHLALVVRQKHTQFPGPGRTESNVVGTRLWPRFAAKTTGLFFLVGATTAILGGLAQINPVWLYGPYNAAQVSAPAQPDWYMGWLEGALRLFPNWEIRAFGFEIPNPFFPGVLLPGLTFAGLYLWPFIEARILGDSAIHHLADRPSTLPWRTAIGVTALSFYGVLFIAGSNDILASRLHLSINAVTQTLRALLFVVPAIAGVAAHRVASERGRERLRPRQVSIARTTEGGFSQDEPEEGGE
jgi:ubiquinol-cytochrome c reductase cytochrome b subunit